jgi:hypothetical protein
VVTGGSGAPIVGMPNAGAGAPMLGTGGAAQPPSSAGGAGASAPITGGSSPSAGGAGGDTGACADCPISVDCQGFPLANLKYSPGGSVLPNKCMPWHPTTNNPYAVRCIDAYPDFATPYPGDEFCILPPPPEMGMQVGLHPQGTVDQYWEQIWAGDYSGYQAMDPEWVLPAGMQITQNYRARSTNTTEQNYYRTYFRMRTGSHHNIITMHSGTEPAEWIPNAFGADALPGLFTGGTVGVLGGQQRPDDSTPVTLDRPPEDAGLYLAFPANVGIIFNMHHFNFTDGPIVREGWSNIWWTEEEATVRASWYMGLEFGQVAFLNVPPDGVQDYHYYWSVPGDVRLIRVFGHRHFWTPNFSTWIERAGGDTELIYQSYDWGDMPTYRYDSVVQNPPIDTMGKNDGATSGVINLKAGDELHFNCHIEYTDQRATVDPAAPVPTETGRALRFANEVYTGEMCIQFGNISGGSLGSPVQSTAAVPDFAKLVR